MEVLIYTKSNCPFCEKAKAWFTQHGHSYTQIVLDDEEQRLAFYQKVSNGKEVRSVPQIFIDGKHIGTYNDLMAISDKLVKKQGGLLEFSETYKPFHYPWAVDLTTRHEKAHWIEDELDLSEDVSDWKGGKMTNIEKEYIINILRLFTQSDVAVGQNYYDQFIPKFKNNEIRNMLGSFAAREGIHQRAYALLNETLGLPDREYHAFLEYAEMADKIEYMRKADTNTLRGLGLSLAKSVFNEGVALFASFVMLLNFQRFGKMKGMGKVVEWSIRDEALISGTQVVTESGNKNIEDITLEDLVLQFDMETREFSFVNPTKTQGVIRDESYVFEHPEFRQHVSPNHRVIYEEDGEIRECLAKDFTPADNKYLLVLDEMKYKKIKSTEVKITHKQHDPENFYCLAVPGKSFVIDDDGRKSVTGNSMHVEGNSKLFKTFCKEHSRVVDDEFKKEIYGISRDIVNLEDKFIDLAYEIGTIEGLDKAEVKQYIRYITDRRLLQPGMKPNFKVKENPLPWLEWVLNGADHTNFFENRVTEYEVAGLSGKWDDAYSA
jgi:ribonucleotide reductase beta subunit family protein with ferritin-like domain/glutaredoxin